LEAIFLKINNLKKVFLGVIVEFSMYFPLVLLVILFRKTKPRHKKLKKYISNVSIEKNETKFESTKGKIKKPLMFPWFLKIFLYIFSFLLMGLSIFFVFFKGKKFIHLF